MSDLFITVEEVTDDEGEPVIEVEERIGDQTEFIGFYFTPQEVEDSYERGGGTTILQWCVGPKRHELKQP
jgi:hypothetical protein